MFLASCSTSGRAASVLRCSRKRYLGSRRGRGESVFFMSRVSYVKNDVFILSTFSDLRNWFVMMRLPFMSGCSRRKGCLRGMFASPCARRRADSQASIPASTHPILLTQGSECQRIQGLVSQDRSRLDRLPPLPSHIKPPYRKDH